MAKRSLDSVTGTPSCRVLLLALLLEAKGFILKFLAAFCRSPLGGFSLFFFFRNFFFFPVFFDSSSDSMSLVSTPAFHNLEAKEKNVSHDERACDESKIRPCLTWQESRSLLCPPLTIVSERHVTFASIGSPFSWTSSLLQIDPNPLKFLIEASRPKQLMRYRLELHSHPHCYCLRSRVVGNSGDSPRLQLKTRGLRHCGSSPCDGKAPAP